MQKKMFFKGSCPGPKALEHAYALKIDFGALFGAQQTGYDIFPIFEIVFFEIFHLISIFRFMKL